VPDARCLVPAGESCLGPKLDDWNQVAQTRETLASELGTGLPTEHTQVRQVRQTRETLASELGTGLPTEHTQVRQTRETLASEFGTGLPTEHTQVRHVRLVGQVRQVAETRETLASEFGTGLPTEHTPVRPGKTESRSLVSTDTPQWIPTSKPADEAYDTMRCDTMRSPVLVSQNCILAAD